MVGGQGLEERGKSSRGKTRGAAARGAEVMVVEIGERWGGVGGPGC